MDPNELTDNDELSVEELEDVAGGETNNCPNTNCFSTCLDRPET